MSGDFTICVGTVGGGVFYSRDGGETWTMSVIKVPVPPWAPWIRIRWIDVDPANDSHMIAASDVGIYRSMDKGATWEHIPSPADEPHIHVWSISFDPRNSSTFYMGLAPGALFRTKDNGKTWEDLKAPVDPRCVVGSTHITQVLFDPRDNNIMWAAIEASGIMRSEDSGDSWVHLPQPGPTPQAQDIHGMVVLPDGKLLASTPNGVWTSHDQGQSYNLHELTIDWPEEPAASAVGIKTYCRGMVQSKADPNTVFVCTGDYVPGKTGGIQISTDAGETWTPTHMDVEPNSTVYCISTHGANTDRMVAASNYGYIYTSEDGGRNWKKVKREFGEIRGLCWVPN